LSRLLRFFFLLNSPARVRSTPELFSPVFFGNIMKQKEICCIINKINASMPGLRISIDEN